MSYVNIKKKQDLVNLRKNLQKKFQAEKLGEQQSYQDNEKKLLPLIKPIKSIKQSLEVPSALPSPTPTNPGIPAVPAPPTPTPLALQAPLHPAILKLDSLSDKYLKKLKEIDHAYGLKPIEGSIDFQLGRKTVEIEGNDLVIDNKKYIGTDGLWRLVMLRDPGQGQGIITSDDYENYTNIMTDTLAFLKEDGTVKSNRGKKYIQLLKPIYERWVKQGKSGKGMGEASRTVFLSSDINTLINRHRLLFLQMRAGNTNANVFNELNAINDELIRLKVFDEEIITAQRLTY